MTTIPGPDGGYKGDKIHFQPGGIENILVDGRIDVQGTLEAKISRLTQLLSDPAIFLGITPDDEQILRDFGLYVGPLNRAIFISDLDLFNQIPDDLQITLPIYINFHDPFSKYKAGTITPPNIVTEYDGHQSFNYGKYKTVEYRVEPSAAAAVKNLIVLGPDKNSQPAGQFYENELGKFLNLEELTIGYGINPAELNNLLHQGLAKLNKLHYEHNNIVDLLDAAVLGRMRTLDLGNSCPTDAQLARITYYCEEALESLTLGRLPKGGKRVMSKMFLGEMISTLTGLRNLTVNYTQPKDLTGIDQSNLESLEINSMNDGENQVVSGALPIAEGAPLTKTLKRLKIGRGCGWSENFNFSTMGANLIHLEGLEELYVWFDGVKGARQSDQESLAAFEIFHKLGQKGLRKLTLDIDTESPLCGQILDLPAMPDLECLETAMNLSNIDFSKFPKLERICGTHFGERVTIEDFPPHIKSVTILENLFPFPEGRTLTRGGV